MMLKLILTSLAIRSVSSLPASNPSSEINSSSTSVHPHQPLTQHLLPPASTPLVPTRTSPEAFPDNDQSTNTSDLTSRDFVKPEGCTWGDWAGDKIPCDTYSLIFDDETGDPNAYYTNKARVRRRQSSSSSSSPLVPSFLSSLFTRRTDDDGTDKQIFAVRGWGSDGKVWTYRGELYCPDDGTTWEDFHVAGLPWSLEVHGGNACQHVLQGFAYDNTWVKYANQYFNTPTDGRCQLVGTENLAMRCLVPTRPPGSG